MRNSKQWSINLESGATDKINAIGDAHPTTDDDDKSLTTTGFYSHGTHLRLTSTKRRMI